VVVIMVVLMGGEFLPRIEEVFVCLSLTVGLAVPSKSVKHHGQCDA